jgi:hypothetical protein
MHGDLGTIASLCAILVTVGGGLRWLYRAIARLEHAVKVVEGRSVQLTPNGGSSIKDDITAIRKTVDAHSQTLARQDDSLRDQGAAITRLAERFDNERPPAPGQGD